MKRIGLIARADNGGLGNQTWEFFRHMKPEKTVVLDTSRLVPRKNYLERYPGSPEQAVCITSYEQWVNDPWLWEWLCTDVDVIYTAETPYAWEVFNVARTKGVRTVLHANYELLDFHVTPDLVKPDALWMSSHWNADKVPDSEWGVKRIMPTPVDRERCAYRERSQAINFLAINGDGALGDRNGIADIFQALPSVHSPITLTVAAQRNPYVDTRDSRVSVVCTDVVDYWDLYRSADVLVIPRRFGGQSLPMQEALSCGMPVISLAVEPQVNMLPEKWLVEPVYMGDMMCKVPVATFQTLQPDSLGALIDSMYRNENFAKESAHANALATALDWKYWDLKYRQALEEA